MDGGAKWLDLLLALASLFLVLIPGKIELLPCKKSPCIYCCRYRGT